MDNIYSHLTDDDLANEIWKPITGYPNYMISSCGRVKSLNYHSTGKEKLIKLDVSNNGYLRATMCLSGKAKKYLVHRIVALHFIENELNKEQVNHKSGDKFDNRVPNLEWMTPTENMQHAQSNGLYDNARLLSSLRNKGRVNGYYVGENHPWHKLTDDDIKQIRIIYAKGNITLQQLSEEFGVTPSYICNIVNNKKRKRQTPANDEHNIAA